MRTLYEKLSRYALLRAALCLALGLLLVFVPSTVTHTIVYIIAGYLAFLGVLSILDTLRTRAENPFAQYGFVFGVLMIVAGLIVALFARQLVSILPIFFGVLLILGGAGYIGEALSFKERRDKPLTVLWILAVILIGAGILIVFNPFQTLLLLLRVFGAALALYGIGEIVTFFLFRSAR